MLIISSVKTSFYRYYTKESSSIKLIKKHSSFNPFELEFFNNKQLAYSKDLNKNLFIEGYAHFSVGRNFENVTNLAAIENNIRININKYKTDLDENMFGECFDYDFADLNSKTQLIAKSFLTVTYLKNLEKLSNKNKIINNKFIEANLKKVKKSKYGKNNVSKNNVTNNINLSPIEITEEDNINKHFLLNNSINLNAFIDDKLDLDNILK